MDNSGKELIERIRQAVAKGDRANLSNQTYDLDTHLMETGYFSADVFEGILSIIALPEFQNLEGSFVLIKIFQDNFDYLDEEQKTKLLAALENSYDSFSDFTSCFLISEIVGESYADERALQTLRRLKTSPAEMPRSMVPHGLDYFIRKNFDSQLGRAAFDELSRMKSDPSEDVRDEVNTALAKLKNRGLA